MSEAGVSVRFNRDNLPADTRYEVSGEFWSPVVEKNSQYHVVSTHGLPNLLENWCHCSCGWISDRMIGIHGHEYVSNQGLDHVAEQMPGYPHNLCLRSVWSYVE